MLLAFASLPLASASPVFRTRSSNANTTMAYDWANITSHTDLIWTPCFDNFTCSRLTVPLDYSDPTIGTTSIAYIRLSASNSTAQDILFNPGGPGGSGVSSVLTAGATLSQYLGTQYNLIGFDPRGVGESGPSLDCFPGAPEAKARLDESFVRPIDSQDPRSLTQEFARAGAYGDWCSRVHKGGDAKYANTPAVAGDMLNYAEKAAILAGGAADEAKLWYYGVSYGTVLGATFASMFPERVGRLILDGVEDSEMYYNGSWDGNLEQADEAVESFFTFCYAAGPDKCVFYANSTQAISQRMAAIFEDVRAHPVSVSDPDFVEFPTIITYETLVFALLSALYTPTDYFPLLAQILVDLEARNASLIVKTFTPDTMTADSAGTLILCLDAAGRYNLSTEQAWEEHVGGVAAQSKYVGDAWASAAVACRNLHVIAPANQQVTSVPSANNTNTPILFIGNTVDPVTPIKGARRMSGLFAGSVMLEQNSVGHCSISSFSVCTATHIQQYLADGSLPAVGTVCQPESLPFEDGTAINVR
ncbi:alpha/beta-hydrolase [Melanomma pulvis-pyrius CBS 109.77]|uniref:Alpha/beta-hydrolase n=1 Tax=Melanomma pulvis-pyrius CBS 109.77 TaxID=1314802 RepID=A0A6A6XXF4_9PLEO|nr:alpha/beta-hydrolase [Melanomma pulvis-pyrius CBS 109.77]